MSTLLSFHKKIIENLKIQDPSTSDLINVTSEEESAFCEEFGITIGCQKPGLRVVRYEIGSKDRYVPSYIYQSFSVLIMCEGRIYIVSNFGCRHAEGRQ